MSYKLIVKDAFWQILGRLLSAIGGFAVTKIMAPYLGPLRYGDYYTILKYFAIWSAFADFGTYVIALRELGKIKDDKEKVANMFGKFTGARYFLIIVVYSLALAAAYFIPSYTANPYLAYGLPIGMLFSASFMAASIQQIPFQIFWKMEKLTLSLAVSRIFQIAVLCIGVYYIWPGLRFDTVNNTTLYAFLFIIFSVLVSSIVQNIYIHFASLKLMKIKVIFDFKFIFDLIKKNMKYGLSYYISSFHFLLVSILLGRFFPTINNYDYVGIRTFAMSLVEILLIVPQALGNSLIHKISGQDDEQKKLSYGNLLLFIIWIGLIFLINFTIYSSSIIHFVGGNEFMSRGGFLGAEVVLPFLAIVLFLSFIKQVFNYYFVTFDHQNDLFKVNLFGLTIGLIVGVPLILKYNIFGGIITQVLLEVLYCGGAIYIAYKNKILPRFEVKKLFIIFGIALAAFFMGKLISGFEYRNFWLFMVSATLLNIIILMSSYKPIKSIVKQI